MYSILIETSRSLKARAMAARAEQAEKPNPRVDDHYFEQRLAAQDLAAAFQEARDWVADLGGSPVYFLQDGKIIAEVLR